MIHVGRQGDHRARRKVLPGPSRHIEATNLVEGGSLEGRSECSVLRTGAGPCCRPREGPVESRHAKAEGDKQHGSGETNRKEESRDLLRQPLGWASGPVSNARKAGQRTRQHCEHSLAHEVGDRSDWHEAAHRIQHQWIDDVARHDECRE